MTRVQLELAKKIHSRRSKRAKTIDELFAGKIPAYFETWLGNPGRYDLPGVDLGTRKRKGRKRGKKGSGLVFVGELERGKRRKYVVVGEPFIDRGKVYVFLGGNTYEYRSVIKELGGKWMGRVAGWKIEWGKLSSLKKKAPVAYSEKALLYRILVEQGIASEKAMKLLKARATSDREINTHLHYILMRAKTAKEIKEHSKAIAKRIKQLQKNKEKIWIRTYGCRYIKTQIY